MSLNPVIADGRTSILRHGVDDSKRTHVAILSRLSNQFANLFTCMVKSGDTHSIQVFLIDVRVRIIIEQLLVDLELLENSRVVVLIPANEIADQGEWDGDDENDQQLLPHAVLRALEEIAAPQGKDVNNLVGEVPGLVFHCLVRSAQRTGQDAAG